MHHDIDLSILKQGLNWTHNRHHTSCYERQSLESLLQILWESWLLLLDCTVFGQTWLSGILYTTASDYVVSTCYLSSQTYLAFIGILMVSPYSKQMHTLQFLQWQRYCIWSQKKMHCSLLENNCLQRLHLLQPCPTKWDKRSYLCFMNKYYETHMYE